ncbi:hypothetical protein D9M69_598900 [compost metagenome]
MHGVIGGVESRVEGLRHQVGDFEGIAGTGPGHAFGDLRSEAMGERPWIVVRDNDERVHDEDSCWLVVDG